MEDDFFIRDLYQIEAVNQGLDVIVAVDGQEALKKIKDEKPGAVLLDLMLPKMDGLSVLAAINRDDQIKNTPVVVITNLSDSQSQQKALALGAKKYMLKIDNNPDVVIGEVKKYLA